MHNLPTAITRNTFLAMIDEWIGVINRHESASIFNLTKRSQMYRVTQFLSEDKYLLGKISEYEDIQFLVLNMSLLAYDRVEDLKDYITQNRVKSKKRCVLLVIGADALLLESLEFIAYLNSLAMDNFSYSIFYFLEHSLTITEMLKKWTIYTSLYQNHLVVPLPQRTDQEQFVRYACARSDTSIPGSVKEMILDQCGGRLWFVSEAIRYYVRKRDTIHLFDHPEILMKVQTVLEEYSEAERSLLEKIVVGERVFNKTENELLAYFQETGLVTSSSQYRISIPLLADYIKARVQRAHMLRLGNDGKLYISAVPVLGYFSAREEELLKLFVASGKQILTRTQVGKILWDQKKGMQYSDWSLDQAIRRLRIKCRKLGLPSDCIVTVKNKGYKWNVQI